MRAYRGLQGHLLRVVWAMLGPTTPIPALPTASLHRHTSQAYPCTTTAGAPHHVMRDKKPVEPVQ